MGRFAFVGKRLLQTIPLLLGITFVTFLIIKAIPGDGARALAGPRATPERVAEVRDELGLDDDVFTQYGRFLEHLAQGDLGESTKSKEPVTDIIGARWEVTAWIIGLAMLFSVLISVPLAAVAASKHDRASDHAVRGITTFGLGMPSFWIGILLIFFVARPTGWFPVGGAFGATALDHARAVFLPALALAVALSPILIRSLRSAMLGVLESEYVGAARSIGVDGARLVRGHVLRNALIPTVALLAVQTGYLFFGAVLMEEAFGLPGLGHTMVFAAIGRDYPLVIGLTMVFAIAVVLVNLVADILLAIIDPRVRIS